MNGSDGNDADRRRCQRTFMDIEYGIRNYAIRFRYLSLNDSSAMFHSNDGKRGIRYYRTVNGSKKVSSIRFMDLPRTDELFIYLFITYVVCCMAHEILP